MACTSENSARPRGRASSAAGGSAFGVVMTGRNCGGLRGPILVPPVLLNMGSWQGVGQVFGGVALAGALAAVALGAMLARRDGVR